MNKFDKFTSSMFSINVIVGFIGFGYFLYQFIGYWTLLLTSFYIGLVVIGFKPITEEQKKKF